MGSDGIDNIIDRNEIAYVAPPTTSDEHSDDIQVTGHGPNLKITNNYLHHNGWLDVGGPKSGGSGPYIHGGSGTNSLTFENNLVRDEQNFMQVADLGTGGTSISNLKFRRNTFYNNGTMWPDGTDLSWQIASGTNNIFERNVVNDTFGNKYGFGTHTSNNNNLIGSQYTLDVNSECTASSCNPPSQEAIGYRCPTDVWWCSSTVSPPSTTATGDVNGDGSVNISDISALLSAYGQTGSNLPADLDKSGTVNIQDLSIILTNYGKTNTPSTTTCPLPAYPDASCTGVPAGTSLTAYVGPLNITTPDTVISGKIINGTISAEASGVIIKNSIIHGGVYSDDKLMYGKVGLVVEDSEIDCGGVVGSSGVGEAHFTLRRVEITQCENGIDANQNILIEDSYIHNLSHNGADPHEDGIQLGQQFWNGSSFVSNGLRNITIRHNTIYGMGDPNDSAFGTSAWIGGPIGADGILLEGNLLAGGAYTVYCSRQGENPTSYKLINNHFTTRFKQTVGYYGTSSDCANDYQSGNVIHETGQPISLGD